MVNRVPLSSLNQMISQIPKDSSKSDFTQGQQRYRTSASQKTLSTFKLPTKFQPLFIPSRYKAWWGGRGGAKSHSFAKALLIKGRQKPLRILGTREIQRSIKDSVKRLLDDEILKSGLSDFYSSTDTEIKGKNGTLFLFAGLRHDATAIRSLEGIDIAWVEEANTVSQRSLDTLLPTIRKEDSEIWFSWNPKLPTDPVDKMFRGGNPPPNSIIVEVHYFDNPWFPKVLKETMEWDKRRDPDKYAHVWRGAYLVNSESRVFRNWISESFDTPDDARFYFGADWGFAIDPTVLIRCFIDQRKLYIDREVFKVGCEIDAIPKLFKQIPGSADWVIRADSSRPETISYVRRNGFPRIEAAKKGPNSIKDGVEFIKSYDVIIHPSCEGVIDEFTFYSYKVDKVTDEVLPVIEDKKNHRIDSIRYALEKLRLESLTNEGSFVGPIIIDEGEQEW